MRNKYIWRACLLTAVALLVPRVAFAQQTGYAPPDYEIPLPISSTHPEAGGFFTFLEFALFHQTNPEKNQLVALRGFIDVDGTVVGKGAGSFFGSGDSALDINDVRGPASYEPGFKVGVGWKFTDGTAATFDYLYLSPVKYTAAATSAPQNLAVRQTLSESFITAFVYNFPNNYAGPARKTQPGVGSDFAIYGIWNGASIMTLEFKQFAQQYEATYRIPIYETETFRMSGIVGPRFFWIYDRLKWTTTSLNDAGASDATDVAVYTNTVSNRMYGAFIGTDNEWYIGHGFAVHATLDVAALGDFVKETARYQLGYRDPSIANKRARTEFDPVPELEGKIGLMWYPAPGIQMYAGFDAMAFWNTKSSPQPISFNYGALDPRYERTFRFFEGLDAGIAFTF